MKQNKTPLNQWGCVTVENDLFYSLVLLNNPLPPLPSKIKVKNSMQENMNHDGTQ